MIIFDADHSTHRGNLRKLALLVALIALFLITACDQKDKATSQIVIKFPHVTAPITPKGQAAEYFKQAVQDRLAGRVRVDVFPSSQLMNDDDSLESLAFGEVQMIAISLSKLNRLTHKFQVFDLPFLFPDLQAIESFQASEAGDELLNELADRGIQGLTFWPNGMKHMMGPVAMRKPEDAAGLLFRIQDSDVIQAGILQIGAFPQKMAFSEIYMALQTGAIDAQENTWSNAYASKFYEVQAFMTETNHSYAGYLVAVNTDFWKSLPDDIRHELDQIVKETATWAHQRSIDINQESLHKILASGQSELVRLSSEELAAWQAAMQPVWAQFEEAIGKDLIQAARDASLPRTAQ